MKEQFVVDYYPNSDDKPLYKKTEDPRAKNVVEIIKSESKMKDDLPDEVSIRELISRVTGIGDELSEEEKSEIIEAVLAELES